MAMTTSAMAALTLFSILFVCSASESDHDRAYASACLSLFRASSPSANSSFVFSPFSLTAALALLHGGADEEAQKEIATLLLQGSTPAELAQFYSGLIKNVLNDSENSLLMAYRLFAAESFKLDKVFAAKAEMEFQAGIEHANFDDGVGSAKKINAFIASNTANRIKDVVKAEDIKDAALFLVNALSFTASWENNFYPGINQNRTFHGAAGKRENVEFMTAREDYFSYHESDSAQVLSIAYEKSEHFSFVIILPKPAQELKEFQRKLSPDTFLGLLNGVKLPEDQDIHVVIPKFSIESSTPATEALKRLGVNGIFSAGNQKKIANDPLLYVSDVKHEALIKIHENGTDAAATTVIKEYPISANLNVTPFIADRPFLFAIVAEKKYPVFLGQYV